MGKKVPLADVDLNLMRVFQSIYEEGNLTTVAERLNLTQPAVSYSLRRLRDVLGDPLFIRTNQRMEPTPVAQRLAPPIHEALLLLQDAIQDHQVFDPESSKRVFRLSMSDIGEIVFLPPLIEFIGQHAPGIRLEVDPGSLDTLADALRQGNIDLAIGNLVQLNPFTNRVTLFHEDYACMVRADHPIAGQEELSLHDFLSWPHIFVSSSSNAHRSFEEILVSQGVRRHIALQVPHFTVVPDIIERSNMICSIPHQIAVRFNRYGNFKIFSLPMDVPPSEVAVHWHPRFEHDEANKWLRQLVIKFLKTEKD